jgi:hypothetical protein
MLHVVSATFIWSAVWLACGFFISRATLCGCVV